MSQSAVKGGGRKRGTPKRAVAGNAITETVPPKSPEPETPATEAVQLVENMIRRIRREIGNLQRREEKIQKFQAKMRDFRDRHKIYRAVVDSDPQLKLYPGRRQSPDWVATAEFRALSSEVRRTLEEYYQATIRAVSSRTALYIGGKESVGKIDVCVGDGTRRCTLLSGMDQKSVESLSAAFDVIDHDLQIIEDTAKRQYKAVYKLRMEILDFY